jgi:multisubunit Na+/H+ antiporter MnhB subunit
MKRLVVIDVSVRLIYPAVIVGSVYLLFAGHNQPGGGFVAGLVTGAAIALRYAVGGIEEIRAAWRLRPWTFLGVGLLVATTTAAVPLALGGAVLEGGYVEADVALLGHVKLTSALLFDLGVYLAVVGMVLMAFEAFGDDPEGTAT